MDKREVITTAIEVLRQQRMDAQDRFEKTRAAIIDAPGAMQSYSDTTRYQLGRIADDLNRLISETSDTLRAFDYFLRSAFGKPPDRVRIASLVETEDHDGRTVWYLIFGRGGGLDFECQGHRCLVITPATPIAQGLIGLEEGDVAEIATAPGIRRLTIKDIG